MVHSTGIIWRHIGATDRADKDMRKVVRHIRLRAEQNPDQQSKRETEQVKQGAYIEEGFDSTDEALVPESQ